MQRESDVQHGQIPLLPYTWEGPGPTAQWGDLGMAPPMVKGPLPCLKPWPRGQRTHTPVYIRVTSPPSLCPLGVWGPAWNHMGTGRWQLGLHPERQEEDPATVYPQDQYGSNWESAVSAQNVWENKDTGVFLSELPLGLCAGLLGPVFICFPQEPAHHSGCPSPTGHPLLWGNSAICATVHRGNGLGPA